jgi:hypothetical protein
MNRNGIKGFLLISVVCLLAVLSIQAGDSNASPAYLYTDQELDNLLAPIALYPDPLLAQILPASTYPAEIADVYNWLNSGGAVSGIEGQGWDESVKAISHYPNILKMMAESGDWTANLGNAFLNQPEDVAGSVQRLRWQAREAGNLESTSQQTVAINGDYIEIIPAQPQYIYVPLYDPSVIYVQRWYPGRPRFITFGLGLVIGGWLTMDFDWGQHHVIYHGWNRSGWVNHSRPYVQVRNVYINRSRPFINQAWRHDTLRGSPESYRASHPGVPGIGRSPQAPEIRGRVSIPSKPPAGVFGPRGNTSSFSNRGKESRGIGTTPQKAPPQDLGKRPIIPPPTISQQQIVPAPRIPLPVVSKGTPQTRPARESVQPPPRTPSVAFGGYRGANEARGQSLRGRTSRQNSEGVHPPVAPVTKSSAPERKDSPGGKAPSGKDDTRGKMHR